MGKKKAKNNKISFDEETVTKESAQRIITEEQDKLKSIKQQEKKKQQEKIQIQGKSRKRKLQQTESEPSQIQDELDPKKPEIQKGESIRAKKRKKHEKLLQDKRNKTELDMQETCLSYLSLWKHSRTEWKFQKRKQIWLQQNLFDDIKIPEKFWDVLVEYFDKSMGKVRAEILKTSLKVVEEQEKTNDEEGADSSVIKYDRARTIVQHLQE